MVDIFVCLVDFLVGFSGFWFVCLFVCLWVVVFSLYLFLCCCFSGVGGGGSVAVVVLACVLFQTT